MKPKTIATNKRPLRERDIEKACSDFLALDGWRRICTDPPRMRGLGVQEKGIADCLYIRYRPRYEQFGPCTNVERLNLSASEVMWIEWKRPRGVTSKHQTAWHVAERARGALTLIASVDFPPTYDGFVEFYRKSGLLRRAGL